MKLRRITRAALSTQYEGRKPYHTPWLLSADQPHISQPIGLAVRLDLYIPLIDSKPLWHHNGGWSEWGWVFHFDLPAAHVTERSFAETKPYSQQEIEMTAAHDDRKLFTEQKRRLTELLDRSLTERWSANDVEKLDQLAQAFVDVVTSVPGPPGGRPVFRPGEEYMRIDTSKLPPGTVIPDGVPPGHVSVRNVPPEVLKNAVTPKPPKPPYGPDASGKFPK
jgi:hypothetical protein